MQTSVQLLHIPRKIKNPNNTKALIKHFKGIRYFNSSGIIKELEHQHLMIKLSQERFDQSNDLEVRMILCHKFCFTKNKTSVVLLNNKEETNETEVGTACSIYLTTQQKYL